MDTTESLPIIAISIGLYQMFYRFNKVRKSGGDTEFDIVYILSGIIASLLWTVYQYRKGSNISVIYSSMGLFLGMYTLLKMLKSIPANKKEEWKQLYINYNSVQFHQKIEDENDQRQMRLMGVKVDRHHPVQTFHILKL